MSTTGLQAKLDRIVAAQLGKSGVGEIMVSVHTAPTAETVHSVAGAAPSRHIDHRTPFFLASTTKLFGTAITLQLQSEGRLRLDDPVTRFFPASALAGLHRVDGREFTEQITVRHLLSHTSGLPDYFEDKRRDGTQFATSLLAGTDARWSPDDVIVATWCHIFNRAQDAGPTTPIPIISCWGRSSSRWRSARWFRWSRSG